MPIPEESHRDCWQEIAGADTIINAERASTVARLAGLSPTLQDIERLKTRAENRVTFEVYRMWAEDLKSVSMERLLGLFKHFDKEGKGSVPLHLLKHIMCSGAGEPLTEAEWAEIVELVRGKEHVDYFDLLSALMQ